MGTRRTKHQRRRKGGVAIASGSDGCVFDKRFNDDGTAEDAPGIVSKVFPQERKSVAENEFDANELVKKVTGGVGVAISTGKIRTIPAVKDSIPETVVRREENPPNACANVLDQKEGVFYVIESPRIKGTLITLDLKDLPVKFFTDAVKASQLLGEKGLCHMDIAPRNIFVSNDDKALIGDFGNLLSLEDRDLKTKLRNYLAEYGIKDLEDCLATWATSATFRIAMLVYTTDNFQDVKRQIENQLLKFGNYTFMIWYDDAKKQKEDRRKVMETEMKEYLETMLKLEKQEDVLDILKKEFRRSDIRCLTMIMVGRCAPSLELDSVTASLWDTGKLPDDTTLSLLSRLAALRRGGRRTRRKRVKMSRRK